MLRLDLELGDLEQVHIEIEKEQARIPAELAQETERVLRRRNTLWPQDTGHSRDRFRAEDDHSGDVVVTNTASYAPAVNNRPTYPRGGANPNYQATQRTILARWVEISTKALKKVFS